MTNGNWSFDKMFCTALLPQSCQSTQQRGFYKMICAYTCQNHIDNYLRRLVIEQNMQYIFANQCLLLFDLKITWGCVILGLEQP